MSSPRELTERPAAKWIALGLIALVTWTALRLEGRRTWCKCRTPRAFIADASSEHTSQHLLDPYSFTHLQHGLVFWGVLALVLPRASFATRLLVAAIVEAIWEIVENSAWVINRYREATAALGYEGDSAVNSLGDLLACLLGFLLAERIGWRGSCILFVAIEVVLIATIRDSLLLNVLMLFHPVEAVKQWQLGH